MEQKKRFLISKNVIIAPNSEKKNAFKDLSKVSGSICTEKNGCSTMGQPFHMFNCII